MTKKKDAESPAQDDPVIVPETAASEDVQAAPVEEAAEEKPAEKKKKAARKKPAKEKPQWVNYEKEEVEKLILKLADSGKSKSQIGLMLRDQYGIPDVKVFGMTIGKVVRKDSPEKAMPEDLYNIIKKAVVMHNHLEKNRKDKKGIHTLQLIESRARKLGRYYVSVGKLPVDWKYDINKAKLLVK